MNLKINRIINDWPYAKKISYSKNFVTNKVSPGRRFARQEMNLDLWKKSFEAFNIIPEKEEPVFGNLLMNHFEEKACTHIHRDSAPKGYVHIRANVMLKKPKIGGDIIIDKEQFSVKENDLWLILASLENHGSTPIYEGERLLYSFGCLIKKENLINVIKN
jgi:hypothetical protein